MLKTLPILRALAEEGIPIEHREGVKETFVSVHIMKLPVVSGKDVIGFGAKTGKRFIAEV